MIMFADVEVKVSVAGGLPSSETQGTQCDVIQPIINVASCHGFSEENQMESICALVFLIGRSHHLEMVRNSDWLEVGIDLQLFNIGQQCSNGTPVARP